MSSGLDMVVQVRLDSLEDALRNVAPPMRPGEAAAGTWEQAWATINREMERVRSAVDKALAGGAPRGVNGRPDRTQEHPWTCVEHGPYAASSGTCPTCREGGP